MKTEEESPATTTSTAYEDILKQIAAQRAKLSALQTGAQALSQDIVTLDATLGEEQGSISIVFRDAHAAVKGWQDTWSDYSRCEPLQALQDKPNILAMLIQSMSWQDKKDLFEQIVASCRPREIYQLQNQLSVRHGQVLGFDLLEGFPFLVSKLIMMHLRFVDLANCRMVSRNWKHAATAYDVVALAVRRLTYVSDSVSLESVDESRKNWNQLCRYHERNLRWVRGKPASLHAMLGHSSYVTSLKSRGEWIVSGGYDEKVRLWEAATGKCMKIWEVDSAVSCVELFVDPNMDGGGVVVAAFVDIGLIKIWSLHGRLNMHTLTGHQKGVRAIAINENYLVTVGFDQTVLVWNWSTGRRVASFRAHNDVILGVHLSNNTVYTVCIDATFRAFDIPSRALLYQAKLLEIRQGTSLQWCCLHGRTLLTATSKKVYVWQLEHLGSFAHQQQQLRPSFRCSVASAVSSENNSSSGTHDRQSTYLYVDRQSRSPLPQPRSPSRSRSTSPFNYPITPPRTPSSASFSSSCLSHPYNSISGSSSSLSLPGEPLSKLDASLTDVETNVKPCLTAVLNMAIDMWCGKITHHDTPLLILGSRSSPVKLSVLELTKDIIDPSKVYDANNIPLLLSPKCAPVQGMPGGHGRGVMCIDTDTNKLVVGCTGGSIHAFYMDPAKRASASEENTLLGPLVITLPHHSPSQTDSIRSVTSVNSTIPIISPTPSVSPSRRTSLNALSQPRRTVSGMQGGVAAPAMSRASSPGLLSPCHLPQKAATPIILAPTRRGVRDTSPQTRTRAARQSVTPPPSDYEEQEEDSMYGKRSKGVLAQGASGTKKKGVPPSPPRASPQGTVGASKTTASSSTSHTLSSLSKFMPPPRIMSRRASSDQAQNTTVATTMTLSVNGPTPHTISTPKGVITKGRSRSDPNILLSASSDIASSAPKKLSKGWSLPSPWANSLKRSSKSKAP
ncbi:hypothetical protein BGX21_006974 [Mortierella sp. AD011]|nr:hypothetical protein BGX20_002962 [Mortierella sp. AD010]KAF9403115.1 hypothetical protein BGX21_006974 [Mortierella sp. AD011]